MPVVCYLKHYRARRGLSQQALATLLGHCQPSIAKWEKGVRVPNVLDALQIAARLDVPVSSLWPLPCPAGLTPDLWPGEGLPK